jgi:hypothetical protein
MATAGAIAKKMAEATSGISESIEEMSNHLGLGLKLSPTSNIGKGDFRRAMEMEHLAKVLGEIKQAVIKKVPRAKTVAKVETEEEGGA